MYKVFQFFIMGILAFALQAKELSYQELLQKARELPLSQASRSAEYIERAKKLEPNNPNAYAALGVLYYRLGEYKKAGQQFQASVEYIRDMEVKQVVIKEIDTFTTSFQTKQEKMLFAKAYNAIEQNQPQIAIPYMEKAIELNPGNIRLYYEIGYAYVEAKRFHLAKMYFEKAHEINPTNLKILRELAFVYGELKQEDKVQSTVRYTLRIYGRNPYLLQELAMSYFRSDLGFLGESTLKFNIKEFPGYHLSYYTLGQYYYIHKKYK
ncbi:MAG: tetratricopeptide repeat protein, partial [Spirochaetota bacterium]